LVGLAFEEHVGLRRETNASTENVFNAFTLSRENVDNRSASRNTRSL